MALVAKRPFLWDGVQLEAGDPVPGLEHYAWAHIENMRRCNMIEDGPPTQAEEPAVDLDKAPAATSPTAQQAHPQSHSKRRRKSKR